MKHIQVQMENGRIFTYETDLKKLRVGSWVEVPPPFFLRDPQWGKVVSLTSDYAGDLVRVMRIVPQAEVKAEMAERRAAKRRSDARRKADQKRAEKKRLEDQLRYQEQQSRMQELIEERKSAFPPQTVSRRNGVMLRNFD